MSSSRSPTQMKKMLRAGMKLEKGMGSGSERKAEERTIERPQNMCDNLVLMIGCLKAEILVVKALNFKAAL